MLALITKIYHPSLIKFVFICNQSEQNGLGIVSI